VLFGYAITTLFWLPTLFAEQRPDYKVEMILFTQLPDPKSQTEAWDGRLIQPDVGNAVDLSYDSTPEGFVALTADARDLTSVTARLRNSPRYRVIKHLVWRQPGLGKTSARSVHIQGGTDYSTQFPDRLNLVNTESPDASMDESASAARLFELDGTVTIVLGRYLHVYTDLVFRQPISTPTSVEEGTSENSTALIDFQIKNRRRMRSRELHYLDHPRLGVLVQITPLEN
jgi:hypothetical protein